MDPGSRALLASYLAHVLIGVVQALIFAHFHRLSAQDHLKWWTWCFVAMALYHASAAMSFVWVTLDMHDLVSRFFWSWLAQVALYVQIALLLLGSFQIGAPPFRRAWVHRAVVGAVLLGSAVCVAYAFTESATLGRLWLRVGMRDLLSAVAFLVSAAVLWRQRRTAGIGPSTVAVAFGAYGLLLALQFALFAAQMSGRHRIEGVELVGVFDLLVQACIVYGLMLWVAEDERTRADGAARDVDHARRFDAQTGLPNRSEFERLLDEELSATDRPLAVYAVEVANLDRIATSFGVQQAQAVAREVTKRLRDPRAAARTLGRLSENRFAVAVVPAPAAEHEQWAQECLARMDPPFDAIANAFPVECRIGIAVGPADGASGAALVAHAERAMTGSTQRIAFYSPQRDADLRRRLAQAEESRVALRGGQIVAYFQPIVHAGAGAIDGFEVLARWLHPERGVLLPAEFLDALNDQGLLAELDRRMLEQACMHGRELAVARISVNISSYAFERHDFVDDVQRVLASSGLPAQALCLEITESTALIDLRRTRDILIRLRALGVSIALDDFGTGYSSLAHLRELPIDSVKIDRVFVQASLYDARTAAIVEAVIALARRLELRVVIEGVEERAEVELFRRLGATLFQGWYFAPAYGFSEARALSRVDPMPTSAAPAG